MTGAAPSRAMVLAAGLGLRLRPITESRPKPLVCVAGRTILDRALDALAAAGIGECVVNTHYLGEMIAAHVEGRARPRVRISPERELLDTGGGVAAALPLLGPGAFFTVNADILWDEGPDGTALSRLAAGFDPARMDALLLVVPLARAPGYDGVGDFFLGDGGTLARRGAAAHAPFVYTGLQIFAPDFLAAAPGGAFSLNLLYDRAIARGRLHGLVHDGRWFHVGTPEALALTEKLLGAAAP